MRTGLMHGWITWQFILSFGFRAGRALDSVRLMSNSSRLLGVLLLGAIGFLSVIGAAAEDSALLDIERRVAHGFATNNEVRIHYATLG